jgi:hypothetical protein
MNSQLLVFVTDSSVRIIEAKVRTASNQVINLVPSTSPQASNAFSLTNLPAGVYALDVITQKGNTKAAYEGILAIGQQPLTVIEETTKRVTNEYGDLILLPIFLPPEECPPGTTGIPPDCEPIPPPPDPCDGPNPPPNCPVPPPDPCDGPNPPPNCPVPPPDPCDGPNPPPNCPVPPPDPCDGPNPPPECEVEPEPVIDGPCDIEPLPEECEEPQPYRSS